MTTSTTTTEWFHHFYNQPTPSATLSGQPSDSTVISTVVTTANEVSGRPSPAANAVRVARPARRRPRASRKNPTTLLNTDTTNFRAMVQRYTGGGSMTYSASDSGPENFNIGGGFHQGQIGNFNPLQHGSMAGIDLQASHLHQQLLMQQFGSTADMNASSASSHVATQGIIDHLYPNSSTSTSSMGGDNKRNGFMF